jgi:hypothetical protein
LDAHGGRGTRLATPAASRLSNLQEVAAMKRIVIAAFFAALLAACASGPPRVQTNETLERYLAYAGAPVGRFTSFNLHSWESVADDSIVLRTGVNEAYLLTLLGPCSELNFATRIRVVSHMPSSVSKLDRIIVGRDSCMIKEIRPIDVKQMKADAALAKRLKKEEAQSRE